MKKPTWKVGDKAFVLFDGQINRVWVTWVSQDMRLMEVKTYRYGLFEIAQKCAFKTAEACRRSIKVVIEK